MASAPLKLEDLTPGMKLEVINFQYGLTGEATFVRHCDDDSGLTRFIVKLESGEEEMWYAGDLGLKPYSPGGRLNEANRTYRYGEGPVERRREILDGKEIVTVVPERHSWMTTEALESLGYIPPRTPKRAKEVAETQKHLQESGILESGAARFLLG